MGSISKRVMERHIKGFGFVLGDLGEGLRKQSFDLDWMLLGIESMPVTEYLNNPLVQREQIRERLKL